MISDSNVQLEYTPFVFQVNPARGGESIAPSLGAGIDKSTFRLDYRRDFFYYNIAVSYTHLCHRRHDAGYGWYQAMQERETKYPDLPYSGYYSFRKDRYQRSDGRSANGCG